MSDSGDDIFLTQSKYSQENSAVEVNLIDTILNMEEEYPKFDLRTDLFSDISEFESGDDEVLIKATQEAEKQVENKRFGRVLTDTDLAHLVQKAVPKNTQSKSKWAVNAFESWRKNRNNRGSEMFNIELLEMDNSDLDRALSFFVGEVRNQSGQEYQPKTLYEMIIAIQHFLRFNGRNVNFLEDPQFSNMKLVLDAKMKELSQKGLGINTKQAEIITILQENVLWDKGLLGTDIPQKLLDTLVYSIGLNFALRAGQEHRNLRIGPTSQLKLIPSDFEGRRYLLYKEDVSKTNCGGLLHRKVEPKTTRAYENLACPERCIVRMYEQYMSKRPIEAKSSAFYLRPKKNFNDKVWYDDVPVGIHTLQLTVGRLCKEAGFVGHYTNHSLRATAATRLYAAGVDEQLISEKTGHRSNAVRTYKRTSEEQQAEVSDILQAAKVPKTDSCERAPVSDTSGREFKFQANGMAIHLKF